MPYSYTAALPHSTREEDIECEIQCSCDHVTEVGGGGPGMFMRLAPKLVVSNHVDFVELL